jgi:hypothetical protein
MKDVTLSLISKFDLYANLCFISVINQCGISDDIVYTAFIALLLKIILEIIYLIRIQFAMYS